MISIHPVFFRLIVVLLFFQTPVVYSQGDYRSHYSTLEAGDVLDSIGWDATGVSQVMQTKHKKLLFFIDPGDCTTCIDNVLYWLKYTEKYADLESALIIVESSDAVAQRLQKQYGIEVPCFADASGDMFNKFQILSTPIFFVLDEQNKLLDFDKCGGDFIDEARLDALIENSEPTGSLPARMSKVKQISLTVDGELYPAGAIRDVACDGDLFYAIDKTFRTVIQFNDAGVISGMANNEIAGYRAEQPIQLLIEQDDAGNVEVILYDAAFIGDEQLYTIKFDRDGGGPSVLKKLSILTDSSFQSNASFIRLNGELLFSTIPFPSLWADSTGIAQFIPVYQSKEQPNGIELSPTKNYRLGSTFKDCHSYDGDPRFAPKQNPLLRPNLLKLSQNRLGFYFLGLNTLTVLDSEKDYEKTIELQLSGFEQSDCFARQPKSAIFLIRAFRNKLWVVYQKETFLSGTEASVRSKDFYLQILDMEGNPLSEDIPIPEEAVPGKMPPIFTLTERGEICLVTKVRGESGFAIYKVQ